MASASIPLTINIKMGDKLTAIIAMLDAVDALRDMPECPEKTELFARAKVVLDLCSDEVDGVRAAMGAASLPTVDLTPKGG